MLYLCHNMFRHVSQFFVVLIHECSIIKEKTFGEWILVKMIGLNAFGFCIKNDANEKIELHDIQGETILEQLSVAINAEINTYIKDNRTEKVFCFTQVDVERICNIDAQESFSVLYGRVKTGEYGEQSEIVNIETGDIAYNKGDDEADVMPFGFALAIPAGEMDNGIIIMQTLGSSGIKRALHKRMDAYIKNIDNNFRVEITPVLPRTVLNEFFEKGVLKSIRFIQYNIPDDEADRFGLNHNVESTRKEVIFRNPVGFMQNKALEFDEWRCGARTYDNIVQIDNFQYDELKMDFKIGKTSKTISLSNIEDLQMTIDISDSVKIDGGHPVFDSLKKEMKETAKQYLISMGLIIEEGV